MKKSKLDHIRETGLKTPDAYFDTFDARLVDKITAQKKMASGIDHGLKVPEAYFETFEQNLQKRLSPTKTPNLKSLAVWKSAAVISAIAASLLIMFAIYNTSPGKVTINQIETASIEDYLNNENLNADDIASFLTGDDLELDNFVKNTLTDESLENYLLNNASIEDLIIE